MMAELSKNSDASGDSNLLPWSEDLLNLPDLSAESGPLKVGFSCVSQSDSSASSEDPFQRTCVPSYLPSANCATQDSSYYLRYSQQPCQNFFYGPANLSHFTPSDHLAHINEEIKGNDINQSPSRITADGLQLNAKSPCALEINAYSPHFRKLSKKVNSGSENGVEGRLKNLGQDFVQLGVNVNSHLTAVPGASQRIENKAYPNSGAQKLLTEESLIDTIAKKNFTPRLTQLRATCHSRSNEPLFPRYLGVSCSNYTSANSKKIRGITETRNSEPHVDQASHYATEAEASAIQEKDSFQQRAESIVVARDHANIIGTSRVVCGRKYREYPCPHCQKLFARPSTLMQHQRIHTGERRE